MKEEIIHNGFKIKFHEENEKWYTILDGERVEHESLKKLKELLDLSKKKAFKRIPVFVRVDHYRLGGGRDPEYVPQYEPAEITSVSPHGNAYFVRKGKKNAEKESLRWSVSMLIDTPKNRKLIAEYEVAAKKEWEAEVEQEKIRNQFEHVNGEKLFDSVYGRKI